MTDLQQTLGDLAASNPAASRVFLRHRLDFCCGGKRTLAIACEELGIDATTVARELDAEAEKKKGDETMWMMRPLGEIADHVEQRYHAALRRDLPSLIEAARRVERVHAAKPSVPAGLADVLASFWDDMVSHMSKEEQILFPMIRRGARGQAVYGPVRVMEQEHDSHAENLARIRELTQDMQAPPEACATWRALYAGLANLQLELMEHISLENNVLFLRSLGGAS